jgi:hypothetical protein
LVPPRLLPERSVEAGGVETGSLVEFVDGRSLAASGGFAGIGRAASVWRIAA